MEQNELAFHAQFLSLNGHCLNIEEKTALQSSLLILQENNHFHTVHFWGKIQGVEHDYHIAEGYRGSMMDERIRFYSVDGGISWNQMTFELSEYEVTCIESIRTLFIGLPTHTYLFPKPKQQESEQPVPTEEAPVEPSKESSNKEENGDDEDKADDKNDEKEDEEKKEKSTKEELFTVTEEKRLTWVVKTIDQDGSVVPRGAFVVKKDDQQVIVKNQTFFGMDKYQASKLYNFVHLRTPVNKTWENVVAQQYIDKSLDFADPVDDDIPYGCWSIQYEEIINTVVGRSLLWPGYAFYHKLQTPFYGGFYIGNGLKNVDLCFMLP